MLTYKAESLTKYPTFFKEFALKKFIYQLYPVINRTEELTINTSEQYKIVY